jgi:hypothetical protein
VSASQETVRVYERITESIWQRLAPTFGQRTINAIAKNAITRTARTHPALLRLEVTPDDGLNWEQFEHHLGDVTGDEVSTMLGDLMDEFFEALSNLAGRLIADKVFSEAEKEVEQ